MINFDSLPNEKPSMSNIIPKGQYIATIEKAEMKQSKDETKPDYLNMQLDLTDPESKMPVGKIWAILTESDKSLPMFQLSRLIKALKLPITGNFELKDLTKMIPGKQMLVDVAPEKRNDGKEPERSVIDVFSGNIFYPLEASTEAPTIKGSEDTPFTEPEETVY